MGLPVSSLRYYCIESNSQYFYKLKKDNKIIKLSNKICFGDSYGKTKFPFFKNYFAGGTDTIRGFVDKSVGPRNSQGKICGGNILFSSSINLIFPDSLENNFYKNSSVIFFDFVQIYNSIDKIVYKNNIKCSLGTSFECYSPFGPLVFNLA